MKYLVVFLWGMGFNEFLRWREQRKRELEPRTITRKGDLYVLDTDDDGPGRVA